MDKNCGKIREHLAWMIDGDLSSEQKIYVDNHLAKCQDCREYLKQLKADHQMLIEYAGSFNSTVSGLEERVAEAMQNRQIKAASRSGVWLKVAVAAAVVIVAGIGLMLSGQRDDAGSRGLKIVATKGLEDFQKQVEPGKVHTDIAVTEPVVVPAPVAKFAAGIEMAKAMFEAGDVRALAALARSSSASVAERIAAINYLAMTGDEEAVVLLEELMAGSIEEGGISEAIIASLEKIKEEMLARDADSGDVASGTGDTPEAIAAAGVGEDEGSGLTVFVVNSNGKPIKGANVRFGRKKSSKAITDANGRCWIKFKKANPEYLSLAASRAGFVPMMFAWRVDQGAEIPEKFTFALEEGIVIGGSVVNERDRPIKGVEVKLRVNTEESREKPWPYISDVSATTDRKGKWTTDIIPKEIDDYRLYINLAHSDYVDDKVWGRRRNYTTEQLKAQTAVMVMKRGIAVGGYVVDKAGESVASAAVMIGESRYSNMPNKTTDEKGLFVFENLSEGIKFLTVQADGFAPESMEINVARGMEPVGVVLIAPATIAGRVIEPDGRPIEGARVSIDKWRGISTAEIKTSTDADGKFVLNDAPWDEVKLGISKHGYMSVRNMDAVAGGEEYEIVMYDSLKVSGTVTDAVTGEPIEKFMAVKGIDWDRENSSRAWSRDRHNIKHFTGGKYEMEFTHPYPGHLIRIEAAGYTPSISRIFASDEESVTYDFTLSSGDGVSGVVYRPDGKPAEGAEVHLVTAGGYLGFENNRNSRKRDGVYVRTGADGRFSFVPQTEEFILVAMGDEGFAKVFEEEFGESPEIHLQRFGRVEGDLYIGTKPGVNESVALYYSLPHVSKGPRCSLRYKAVTNEKGKFVIENVAPGKIQVARVLRLSARSTTYTRSEQAELLPGKTVIVNIGGGGRPVIGKFAPPLGYTGVVDYSMAHPKIQAGHPEMDISEIYNIYEQFTLPMPDNFDSMTVAEALQWHRDWMQSDEGKVVQEEMQKKIQENMPAREDANKYYKIIVQPDGSFRADDVPPGDYVIDLKVYERKDQHRYDRDKPIGRIKHEFTLPEPAEGDEDKPFNLGRLRLDSEMLPGPSLVGQPVPELAAETLDGDAVDFSAFGGKIVLLNFWMVQMQEGAEAEMENIWSIYDSFADEDNFELIGVTYGGFGVYGSELVQKYIDEKNIPWQQAIMKMADFFTLPGRFGLHKNSFNVLIGSDGKIIAAGLEGDELKAKVAETIAEAKESQQTPVP